MKLPLSYFFLDTFKTFIKVKLTFWIWFDIFYWTHYISGFSAGNLTLTSFCLRLQTLVLFFLCFLFFFYILNVLPIKKFLSLHLLWEYFNWFLFGRGLKPKESSFSTHFQQIWKTKLSTHAITLNFPQNNS